MYMYHYNKFEYTVARMRASKNLRENLVARNNMAFYFWKLRLSVVAEVDRHPVARLYSGTVLIGRGVTE